MEPKVEKPRKRNLGAMEKNVDLKKLKKQKTGENSQPS